MGIKNKHDYKNVPSGTFRWFKLATKFGCSSEDMCNTCGFKASFSSVHKAAFYLQWLDCPKRTKKEYYKNSDVSKGQQNSDVINAMQRSHERYDL